MVRPTGATQSASRGAVFVVLTGTLTADTLSNPLCSLQLVFANAASHSSGGSRLAVLSFCVLHHHQKSEFPVRKPEGPGQPESAVQYGRSVINTG